MLRLSLTVLTVVLTLAFVASSAWACPGCGCEKKPAAATSNAAAHGHDHGHPHPHPHASADPAHQAPARDRAAILAMAGEFEVTFQFQETVAVEPGYELKEPYRSAATEFVEVIEDTGDFISLQHVLVLHPSSEEGEVDEDAAPRVVKHWRQDWTYQDTDLLKFRGNRTWEHVELDASDVAGTWSQAVYQVDDSPRYEAIGTWTHVGDRSAWESRETWRPLPRREFSKRSDYQVLVARNRHTITPAGWVHEQDNHKLILDAQGQPQAVLAHESGLNVYDRTDDIDFTAGRVYWDQTAAYWQDVRDIWADAFAAHETIRLKKEVDGEKLHAALFALAKEVQSQGHTDQVRAAADRTVESFMDQAGD
jgi:hypothetical protein